MNTKQLGALGEKLAFDYLKRKGYQILDRNYSPKFISGPNRGEIDIIAKKEGVVAFVEVKTLLCSKDNFRPEQKVNFQKRKKIIRAAESWVVENKESLEVPWQIDIIAIKIDARTKKAKISHFKNIAI